MSGMGLTNTQTVMLGASLLGVVSAVVGSFAVLRKRSLVGDMLSHAALPGVCLAFLIVGRFSPDNAASVWSIAIGATITGLLGVLCMTMATRWTRTKEDAALGIVLSSFFGAGVVLLTWVQQSPLPDKSAAQHILLGHAATMSSGDLKMIAGVGLIAVTILIALFKELQAFSFDPEFTQTQGWPGFWLDLLLMGLLTAVTMVGLPAVGVVLMASMLIMPCAAARFWSDRLSRVLMIAAVIGAAMGSGGTWLSANLTVPGVAVSRTSDLPTGPTIVLTGTVIFGISLLFAPGRGVVSEAVRRQRLRRKIADENLLRALFELIESETEATTPGGNADARMIDHRLASHPSTQSAAIDDLLAERPWSRRELLRLISDATRERLIEFASPGRLRFTTVGWEKAAKLARLHRLWEIYLIERANIAPDHVDRDADDIEHFLSPEIVAMLESRLAEVGRLPPTNEVPRSPHPTPSDSRRQGEGAGP